MFTITNVLFIVYMWVVVVLWQTPVVLSVKGSINAILKETYSEKTTETIRSGQGLPQV